MEQFNGQNISFGNELYDNNVNKYLLKYNNLFRMANMKIFQILHLMGYKNVKNLLIFILANDEDNIKKNISNEKTLDLSNNPIVFNEENLTNASMNTNDFSFYEQNEKKVEMNEFDKKKLTEYVNKEKNNLELNLNTKKNPLIDFQQLKFEIKCIENNIENYFVRPIMKNNLKYKKMNKCFENDDEDLIIKTSKKEKYNYNFDEDEGYETD